MNHDKKIAKLQYKIGKEYQKRGDHAGALKFYEQSANLGCVHAQFKLGKLYANGKIEKDSEKAKFWYKKAMTNIKGLYCETSYPEEK